MVKASTVIGIGAIAGIGFLAVYGIANAIEPLSKVLTGVQQAAGEGAYDIGALFSGLLGQPLPSLDTIRRAQEFTTITTKEYVYGARQAAVTGVGLREYSTMQAAPGRALLAQFGQETGQFPRQLSPSEAQELRSRNLSMAQDENVIAQRRTTRQPITPKTITPTGQGTIQSPLYIPGFTRPGITGITLKPGATIAPQFVLPQGITLK